MLSEPEDYGLDVEGTLAHRVAGDPSDGFEAFWSRQCEAIEAMPDRLRGGTDDAVNEVSLTSLDDVTVFGRLHRPPGPIRGAVVFVDGHRPDPEHAEAVETAMLERGLLVLRLVLRGFGPSALGPGPLGDEWILHRLPSPEGWIVRGAVVDVTTAFRAMRRLLGPSLPVSLYGRALGGGLAVIAAAQLGTIGDPPTGSPSPCRTSGHGRGDVAATAEVPSRLVNMVLDSWRQEAEILERTLGLFDAAWHARGVTVPTLGHLASRDDEVPAPAAAAVLNAVPGPRTFRFVTRYGHYDGGLANARRLARWPGLLAGFLDPGRDPGESDDGDFAQLAK